jgi:hypothetical protein
MLDRIRHGEEQPGKGRGEQDRDKDRSGEDANQGKPGVTPPRHR